ncbi:MAG: hypothetical protein ACI9QQ_000189 [Myxococcota bacterium]|jgi:hypothetical protein
MKVRMLPLVVLIVLALQVASGLVGVAPALAQESLSMLSEAVDGYANALDTEDRDLRLEAFRRSERLFAKVADGGAATADLYANLGNASLQAEHLGNAVLAYRRALLLDPDHPRASQNLAHVRGLAPEWLPRREQSALFDSFFQWHRTVSSSERAFAAAVCFAVASLFVALSIALGRLGLRSAAVLPALIWLALVASMFLDPAAAARNDAVVVAREAVARSADSLHAPARFARPLPPGTEVTILEARESWLRIALANGREAWVRASSVVRVEL